MNGWPKNKNNLDDSVKPFWNLREHLHIIDGLLFKMIVL